MPEQDPQFEQRKQEHIRLALMQENQASELNAFNRLSLRHEALPDLNFEEIDISTKRFAKPAQTPFIVSSMTAGHQNAALINGHLMQACAQSGWAMGVGSQRRELFDEQAYREWLPLRKAHPEVTLYSNLGIAQLIQLPLDSVLKLTDSLNAQALIVHANPLQECLQPEGTPQFKGALQALEALVKQLPLPVIVKETGCGFSQKTLERLNTIGVAAVDVSGAGGTHWGRIEGHRATEGSLQQKAAEVFANWGIDTITSVQNAVALSPRFEIWGSGGVRNGLDAAKLLAIGASTVGFAKPLLEAALQGSQALCSFMASVEYELKIAMFCTGSRTLNDLQEKACL